MRGKVRPRAGTRWWAGSQTRKTSPQQEAGGEGAGDEAERKEMGTVILKVGGRGLPIASKTVAGLKSNSNVSGSEGKKHLRGGAE